MNLSAENSYGEVRLFGEVCSETEGGHIQIDCKLERKGLSGKRDNCALKRTRLL